jgi:hypothetical protein
MKSKNIPAIVIIVVLLAVVGSMAISLRSDGAVVCATRRI